VMPVAEPDRIVLEIGERHVTAAELDTAPVDRVALVLADVGARLLLSDLPRGRSTALPVAHPMRDARAAARRRALVTAYLRRFGEDARSLPPAFQALRPAGRGDGAEARSAEWRWSRGQGRSGTTPRIHPASMSTRAVVSGLEWGQSGPVLSVDTSSGGPAVGVVKYGAPESYRQALVSGAGR